MKPGRDLDALVAEKVFGAKVHQYGPGGHFNEDYYCEGDLKNPCNEWAGTATRLKRFSTDITAAWTVVEKIKNIGLVEIHVLYDGSYSIDIDQWSSNRWTFGFIKEPIIGKDLPYVICLTALKTVEGK